MAYYFSQPWEQDSGSVVLAAPDLDWNAPLAAAGPADAEEDDWSGVLGYCHALRPGAAAPGLAVGDDVEDWGYGAHAI